MGIQFAAVFKLGILNKKMKILFFIRSLDPGGAERQVIITAKGLAQKGHDVSLLLFYTGGAFCREIIDTNVRLLNLNKKGRWDLFGFYFRLISILRRESPDVIYSFMGIAGIFSILIRPVIRKSKIVWGVRASNMDLDHYDRMTWLSYKLECTLSHFADKIISNSYAGLEYAVLHGFPESKISVVHNGVDTDRFKPDLEKKIIVRKKWGVADSEILIGLVGRLDPMKGHSVFLKAAGMINKEYPRIRFVCVGSGLPDFEHKMKYLARELTLDRVLIWAGTCSDMPQVYNGLDILVSSSFGEGFSNVIVEAMACGIPCVVTDVGDSSLIVHDAGFVVPKGDFKELAGKMNILINLSHRKMTELKLLARHRVINTFNVDKLIVRTLDELNAIVL